MTKIFPYFLRLHRNQR